jgi:hypothetical protein
LNDRLTLSANIGVVVGLAILIIEISQANRLAETEAFVHRLDQMQQANLVFGESEYLPQIELKYRSEGVQSLSELERLRLQRWHTSVMLRMQGHHYQYSQGYLDQETGARVLKAAVQSLEEWNELGVVIENHDFRRLVEEAAAN